jgi:hypothetical protein
MLHRTQQLGIDPGQPRQGLSIQSIVPCGGSRRSNARCGHGLRSLHAQLAQRSAHPRRMHPCFQRDPAARHAPEHFLHGLRSCAEFLLQDNLARFVQYAIPARSIAQVQSDRQLLSGKIPALLRRRGANLLYCRSPFYLCFQHVDNLGAHTASRRRPAS